MYEKELARDHQSGTLNSASLLPKKIPVSLGETGTFRAQKGRPHARGDNKTCIVFAKGGFPPEQTQKAGTIR